MREQKITLRESRRANDFKFYIDVTPARPDKTQTQFFTPTEVQMKNVVRGDDRYYRRRFTCSPLFWTLLVASALLLGYSLVQLMRTR